MTMRHGSSRPLVHGKPIRIGFLGTMSILAALMIFMYATTFQPETVTVLLSAVVLGIIGLVLAFLFTRIVFRGFDWRHCSISKMVRCIDGGHGRTVFQNFPVQLHPQTHRIQLFRHCY